MRTLDQLCKKIEIEINNPAPDGDGAAPSWLLCELLGEALPLLKVASTTTNVLIDFTGGAWHATIADRPVNVIVVDSDKNELANARENDNLILHYKDGSPVCAWSQEAETSVEAQEIVAHFLGQWPEE